VLYYVRDTLACFSQQSLRRHFFCKDLLPTEVANEGDELPVECVIVLFRNSSLNDNVKLVQPAPSSEKKSLVGLTLNARDSATVTAGHLRSTINGYANIFCLQAGSNTLSRRPNRSKIYSPECRSNVGRAKTTKINDFVFRKSRAGMSTCDVQ
jgi:hypothetical protein